MILLVSLGLMLGLRHIVMRTRVGRAMRAISHDIERTKLMGVDTDRTIAFTFALGAALAGAGGFMVAVLTHVSVTPLFGLLPGIKAFVAAVLGGAGSIPGAVLGGIIMGVAEAFVAGSLTFSTYRDAHCVLPPDLHSVGAPVGTARQERPGEGLSDALVVGSPGCVIATPVALYAVGVLCTTMFRPTGTR